MSAACGYCRRSRTIRASIRIASVTLLATTCSSELPEISNLAKNFCSPTPGRDLDERERMQHRFAFQCACRFCEADRSCSSQVAHRLKEINEVLNGLKMRHNQIGFYSKADALELSKLLEESEKYLDKSISQTAYRVRMALSVAIVRDHPDRFSKTMEENIEIMKNQGNLYAPMLLAKGLSSIFPKWVKKAKEWAKILLDDDRVVEMIF